MLTTSTVPIATKTPAALPASTTRPTSETFVVDATPSAKDSEVTSKATDQARHVATDVMVIVIWGNESSSE